MELTGPSTVPEGFCKDQRISSRFKILVTFELYIEISMSRTHFRWFCWPKTSCIIELKIILKDRHAEARYTYGYFYTLDAPTTLLFYLDGCLWTIQPSQSGWPWVTFRRPCTYHNHHVGIAIIIQITWPLFFHFKQKTKNLLQDCS